MKKLGLFMGGGFILVALLSLFLMNRVSQDTVLAKKVLEQVEKGSSEISLAHFTDFDWEQAKVFGPYTTKEVIEGSMKIKFKGSIKGIDYREDIFLLVFAKGNDAVKTVVLPRKMGNFYAQNGTLTPKDDILVIE